MGERDPDFSYLRLAEVITAFITILRYCARCTDTHFLFYCVCEQDRSIILKLVIWLLVRSWYVNTVWALFPQKSKHSLEWVRVLNCELLQQAGFSAHSQWLMCERYPSPHRYGSVCTSVSPCSPPPPPSPLPTLLAPSVSSTAMLSLSLCVCRQEVTQCLTESRQRDKLISQETHTRGRGLVGGGGRPGVVGWRRGSAQNKTDKRQNAKTLLKHRAMGVLLNSKAPPSPFQQPSPPKTHTCRHTTLSESAEVLGAPPLTSTDFLENKDGGPDIGSVLTTNNLHV